MPRRKSSIKYNQDDLSNAVDQSDMALAPYRALDLTDEKGFLCGKILADLGVDVIKVERPFGDSSRNIGPFYKDIPDPEKSLYWFAFNINKRGITLDITTEDGKAIFRQLVKKSDFVIESFPVGYLESLGLGYDKLSEINPRLIVTSITPFGETGPYKDYKSSDLVSVALGGGIFTTGDPDRPPVRIGVPQAYLHAGSQAAAATVVAHYHREKTGEGQHVDVSIQQSIIVTTLNAPAFWELNNQILHRAGQFRVGISTTVNLRQTWACKDGYIAFQLNGGSVGAKTNRRLVKWMDEEGMASDFLKNFDWANYNIAETTLESQESLEKPIIRFFESHTMTELYEGAIKRDIQLFPVFLPKDLIGSPQLEARNFWVNLEHPELDSTITYPGAFIKLSETPCLIRRRAPRIGEHNLEVYQQLGLCKEELVRLKRTGVV